MPTYEYHCKSCGHDLEEFQSMSSKPLKKCPECGKSALERKIGIGAGVLFKGGGFYETDYRSESYKKGAEAEKPNPKAEAGEKKDPGTADKKPETPKPAADSSKRPEKVKPSAPTKPKGSRSGA